MSEVTVAIPVRDGGLLFERMLKALARQTVPHELLICDSGSSDGSPALAREHGARVVEIDSERFSHGKTRNLLMHEASGAHVALLTQDAEPADPRWLECLLSGFELATDVGTVYGPYVPRPQASMPVRLELERWFGSISPDGIPRIDRLEEDGLQRVSVGAQLAHSQEIPNQGLSILALLGDRGFFTDANACISRSAWERVPFREVAYAEDRVLAIDMLRAGFAKVYVPDAAVVHSHDYTSAQEFKRCFDEWRGLLEVYGWREPTSPAHLTRKLRGELGAANRELESSGTPPSKRCAMLLAVTRHHVVRLAGALLGSRADRLPEGVRRWLSLERRGSFVPLDLDGPAKPTRNPLA